MGITETVKQFLIKVLPGMNNKVEDLDLKDRWVELAQNCRFEVEPGAVDKRDPVTYFNSTTKGSGAVTGLYRFYTSGGTIKFVMIHGTTCYVGSDSAGTWTAIRTSLTDGKRMAFETYKDLLICSNGYDNPFIYDGSSDNITWELGSCKAVLENNAGYNIDKDSTELSYKITIDADAYRCGAVSNEIATVGGATNGRVQLTNIPLGPVGATNRKIFRKNAGTNTTGGAWKLLTTLGDNTTTVYTDDTADVSGAAAIGADTDDMPLGNILKVHRERLFISGDPSNPNKIYYSNVYLPHYIQQTTNLDYMEISPEDNDEIMGIPIQLGVMACIKKNTIRKVHITSAVSGANPATWYADDPISFTGSPAQWSITQTPYGIVFLGWDSWYVFDGAGTKLIMTEFDVNEILPSSYVNVVGFWHNGIMLAAYTDKTLAGQYHDRIMRYNFKRQALSIDLWTSTTISGANCFAAKTGDDETGELYFGDSNNGYVVKDKESETAYRLRTKTECLAGTQTTVFVGGTENSPYMEIGSTSSAQNIPDKVCIFWDNTGTSPGSGWTDVTTTYEGYFIKMATTAATSAATTHTHTFDGSLATMTPGTVNGGDNDSNGGLLSGHGHAYSGTSGTGSAEPKCVHFRLFESNSASTSEFPDGTIVMWDQPTPPTGWISYPSGTGFYVKVSSAGTMGVAVYDSHTHSISATSDSGPGDNAQSVGGSNGSHGTHAHTHTNTTGSSSVNSWELDYAQLHMIQKVSESDTWDGTDKYIQCLVTGSSTPTGWSIVTTYDDRYLKVGTTSASTGAAANASHTHTVPGGTSSSATVLWGGTYHVTQIRDDHTHTYATISTGSADAAVPATAELRLFQYHLGKMKDYNAAITASATGGTWTAPSQEINAESLGNIFWNETIADATNDDVVIHTRTGANQTACEAASWSAALTDPNGSTIASTAADWLQYKIEFTAADTTANNPRVYFTNAYVLKYSYEKGNVEAETSVNFKYDIGFRNFDTPLQDKSFKKIGTVHEGSVGSFVVAWETNNNDDSFNVELSANPDAWESFFQDTAIGKKIDLSVSKNDLQPFRLSEIKGLYSEFPPLI